MHLVRSSMMIEVSSEQSREVSFIYTNSAAGAAAAAAALCVITVFLFLLRRHRVRFHNNIPGPNRLLLYCSHTYSYISACCCVVCCYTVLDAAAAACCCCWSSCAGWQNLFPWFTAPDCGIFFHLIRTRINFNVPLGSTVAFSASIFLPLIHIVHPRYYGHARSQGGR